MTMVDGSTRPVAAEWLLERIEGRSAREIGDGIAALIRTGALTQGEQLPTIRDLARAADISPGTVVVAWNQLRGADLIQTRRRGGTVVTGAQLRTTESRPPWAMIDFLQCAPDISLQPDLRDALLDSLTDGRLNVFGREYMTDALRHAVAQTWPFAAEAWATAGGGTEAILLAVAAAAEPGSRVAVHEPASPGLLDTLRELSLTPLGVESDEEGPVAASLRSAIAEGAVAFVFQPGAEFAMRGRVTPARTAELAAVVAAAQHHVRVVEDDAIGPLASAESPSIGTTLPDRVIRARSYCKAYGIDVRTSVLGGGRELVERTIALRSHGVGSNSRILQNTLASLIGSEAAATSVDRARDRYAARRDGLRTALERHGATVRTGPLSLVLWVDVADETDALVALAAQGVTVALGSRAFVTPPTQPVVRLSPLQLPDDPAAVDELAIAVAGAARRASRQFFD